MPINENDDLMMIPKYYENQYVFFGNIVNYCIA